MEMKNKSKLQITGMLILLLFTVQSCEFIGNVFEAGFWLGILVAFAIVILVIVFVVRMVKRLKK